MKKFLLSNIVLLAPLVLLGDGHMPFPEPVPVMPPMALNMECLGVPVKIAAPKKTEIEHEHRINFGIVNLGYERIKMNCIYIGADAKLTSFYAVDHKKNDPLNYFVNGELRMGYNHVLSGEDILIPYAGIGFSVFKIEKEDGNIRDWNYATIGMKLFHRFGPIFEMGVHGKGYYSIQQKRVDLDSSKQKRSSKDTRWMVEASIPFIWHIGEMKNWEVQLEPYYLQIPNAKRLHLLGSRLSFGYRF